MYELCLGSEPLPDLIDRIARDANAVVPGLGYGRARELVELIFRTRVRQTSACGLFPECEPGPPVWGRRSPPRGPVRPCAFADSDPDALANVFAASAADLLDVSGDVRDACEERLAQIFRAALQPLLFYNDRCGRAAVCASPRTDPFEPAPTRPRRP